MFKFFLRARRTFSFGRLNLEIEAIRDNNYLMEVYNETPLNQEQKALMLESVWKNIGTINQIFAIFNSAIGQRYVKDVISQFKMYTPVQQSWVLSILASTSGMKRQSVVSVNKQIELIFEVCENIDPVKNPKDCLRAYKDVSILDKINRSIEKKVILVLDYPLNLDINDFKNVLKGALNVSRDMSFLICSKVEKILEQKNLENENLEDLIDIWNYLIETKLKYGIGENLLNILNNLILKNKDNLQIDSIYNITNGFLNDNFLPKELILAVFERLADKSNDIDFFWGDKLERIIINIENLRMKNFQINLKEEFYHLLINQVTKLNIFGKIKDSEALFLLSILTDFTSNFPEFTMNNYLERYNEANIYLKICITALFSRLNMPGMENELIKLCKSNFNNKSFSYASISDMYFIIKKTNLDTEHIEVKDLLAGFERGFGSMIVDLTSFIHYSSILNRFEDLYRQTGLWDKMTKSSLNVFENTFKKNERSIVFILSQIVYLYNYSLPSHTDWVNLVKMIIKQATPKDIEDTFYNNFNSKLLGGFIEVLENSPKTNNFGFAHCLALATQRPTYKLLSKTIGLFSRYDKKLFDERKLKITKNSLFSQIFKRGLSSEIHGFLNSLDYIFIINRQNEESLFKLIQISAQYGDLSEKQAIAISRGFSKNLKNDSNFYMAIATVIPKLLEESEQVFKQFMKVNINDLDDILGKINLYIKIPKEFENEEIFLQSIEDAIANFMNRDRFNIIELLQGLSPKHHANKKKMYTNLLNLLIDILIDKNLEWFSVDDIGHALLAILKKGYNKEGKINALEKLIGNKLKNDDLIEALIRVYLNKKRFNDFLDLNYSIGINFLKDSTFFELVEMKNSLNKKKN